MTSTDSRFQLIMPIVDFEKEYPKKTIALQDIADVEYIVLETHDEGLVRGEHNTVVTDSLIITVNETDDIVFFYRDGRFSHSFNRKGNSGMEYSSLGQNLCVNPRQKEVYIYDYNRGRVQVYSYEGEYKKTLKVRGHDDFMWGSLFYIDSCNLLLEDRNNVDTNNGNLANQKPYYKLSIDDGSMTRLPLTVEKRIRNTMNWYDKDADRFISSSTNISPIANINGELIITDFALDTLYAYRNEHLVPIAKKENWMKENGVPWLVTLDAITDKYYLWYAIEKNNNKTFKTNKTILQDRYTGTCMQVRLWDENITAKDWRFRHRMSANRFYLPKNCIMECYPAYNLIELDEKGVLQGELKEIASQLNAEDNPVIMLAKFKE